MLFIHMDPVSNDNEEEKLQETLCIEQFLPYPALNPFMI